VTAATTQETLTGSCLCGSVRYEIEGEGVVFYHCHCSRCRKASGTGHASNIRVSPVTAIRWTCGEQLLKQFKVPEAERYFNNFCSKCGSPMPRVVPQIDAVVIPAGSLDVEPNIRPSARIFWDSRTEWSCAGDDLPCFAEYP
jgi:hypothetical protein